MKKLILMAAATLMSSAAMAQLEAGKYFVKNNESGQFLSNGANWGTRSVLFGRGIEYDVTVADGLYTLKSGIKNTNTALRPSDGFNDQSGAWELQPTEGGYYMYNGSKYFCNDASGVPQYKDTPDASCVWSFVTAAERKALLADASESNPVDATVFIEAADFHNADVKNSAWSKQKVGGEGGGGNSLLNSHNCEQWNAGEFEASQTISGLPNGRYKVTCQGYTRKDGASTASADSYENGEVLPAFLFAGDQKVALKSIFAEADKEEKSGWSLVTSTAGNKYVIANGQNTAAAKFNDGAYLNEVEDVIVADGTLKLGIKSEGGIEWVVFDSFRLTYYGPVVDLSALSEALVNAVTNAKSITGNMNGEVAKILADVIDRYDGMSFSTADEYNDALSEISEAVNNANASIEVYKNVAAALAQTTPDAAAFATAVADIQASYDNGTILDGTAEIEAVNAAYNAAWASIYAVIEPGEYLLQNVETGKYLGAANSWGTQASLLDRGILWNIEAVANGKYTLDSHIANSPAQHYLNGTFTDSDATGFALIAVGDGYALTANNIDFLTSPNNNIVDLSSKEMAGKAVWKLISKEELYAKMTAASEEAPIDATVLAKDANFSRNNTGYDAWVWKFATDNTNHAKGGDNTNNNVESFHAGFEVAQAVNVPNGRYLVTAQGFYRQDGSDNDHLPYFFANEQMANVPLKTGTENSMAEASASFNNGLYKIEAMEVEVTDGILNIGVSNMENDALWVIFDNFEITCLGMAETKINMAVNGYGTFVAPFEVALPAGVKAYTVDEVADDKVTLVMTEISSIAPNTPVLLEGTCNETVSGFAFAEPAEKGMLTGVFEDTKAPAGSFVLQNQNDVIGFYYVATTQPTVPAYHAYLTGAEHPEEEAPEVKAYILDNTTAIKTLESLNAGKAQIFDINGRQQNKLQKGINIVNGVKVLVK